MKTRCIFIPTELQFNIVSKGSEYLVSIAHKAFFFNICVNKGSTSLFVNRRTNMITVKNRLDAVRRGCDITKFLKSWNIFFIKKIKFSGKGFKITKKKSKNFLKLFFGRSHITWVMFKQLRMYKIKKRKILLETVDDSKYNAFISQLVRIKYINLYTKRGLRVARQIYYKRNSRKSAYK